MKCSRYSIDLYSGSVTTQLLEFGDDMVSEPTFDWAQAVQSVGFLRAPNQAHIGRANRTRRWTFSKILTDDTTPTIVNHALWAIDAGAEIPVSQRATLQIRFHDQDGAVQAVRILRDCQINNTNGTIGEDNRAVRNYTVIGGSLLAGEVTDYQLKDHTGAVITDDDGQTITTF